MPTQSLTPSFPDWLGVHDRIHIVPTQFEVSELQYTLKTLQTTNKTGDISLVNSNSPYWA